MYKGLRKEPFSFVNWSKSSPWFEYEKRYQSEDQDAIYVKAQEGWPGLRCWIDASVSPGNKCICDWQRSKQVRFPVATTT